ncbi:helix-turn-helix domain-containing protein [Nocardia brevicatena]|uniref:helix-turn-helix domain-containing protein n=1 Tax=Nocardia brevicatena TaxID=37327 RepID=UPI0012FBD796|nr:helix-turn-helix domain-containing protein [Nocardia brevicatena]
MVIVATWTDRDVRALRDAMSLSQQGFADRCGVNVRTVKRWEAGHTIGRAGQADLGRLLARLTPSETEAFRLTREESDVDRRALFKAAGAFSAAATLTGPGGNPAGPDWLAHGSGRPDTATVELVRSTLHAAMQLDDKLGSPAASGLVTVQQQLTEAMLQDCPAELRPALLSPRAEWVGFSGCLAWDSGDHATAGQRYADARELAHDAEDDDLAAYMLCHMSQLAIWQQRRRTALDYAVAARSWVAQSEDRRLRAYVGIRYADAAGLAGQNRAALSALADAERDLAGLSPCHPSESRAYFAGPGLLESYRGLVLSNLGEAGPAAAASRRAASMIDPEFARDRAVTLLELARPLEQMNDIDEAAAVIGEAAELCERNRSPRLAAAVVSSRHRLAPWATSKSVRELDEQLVGRDIVQV